MTKPIRFRNIIPAVIQLYDAVESTRAEFMENLRWTDEAQEDGHSHLFTKEMIDRVYDTPLHPKYSELYANAGYFILVNAKHVAVAKVFDTKEGRHFTLIEIVKSCPDKLSSIQYALNKYEKSTILLNDSGEGEQIASELKMLGIYFKAIHWGGQCLSNKNRIAYVNGRSQAYVYLAREANKGIFSILTLDKKDDIREQLAQIQYDTSPDGRFKVLSRQEMLDSGCELPDLADAIACAFLEGIQSPAPYPTVTGV